MKNELELRIIKLSRITCELREISHHMEIYPEKATASKVASMLFVLADLYDMHFDSLLDDYEIALSQGELFKERLNV